ncbi:MAG: hypothetical protein IJG09_06590 [Methanobrevibacter sp.]|nr:hypothetical protein [Methanobrevibacter sp.]MBQ2652183.1 hypothetical protein [Methanobrevibacter sp.]
MEEKEKTAEQKFEERQGNNLLNFIIAKTYVRHSKMDEKEFLKEIGFEGTDKSEDEAIRIAKMNVYVETTNQLIKATNTIKQITALLKIYLGDEKIVEEKGE